MPSLTRPQAAAGSPDPASAQTVLTDEMLARFAKRAPQYDRDNVFFSDDFEELREAGYLRLAVPTELGGAGLSLAGVAQQQRRLGYYAAPTALAINMHLYWTGNAADLWRAGDTSLRWLLEAAAAGEVFAAGHAESGNDIPVLLSTTKAERVEGGYRFTGRKSFGSLSPVWTYLGHPRHGHRRSVASRRSSTRSCRATPKAIASSRPGTCSACGRRAATTRSSTASSCPIATSSGSCRPARPASTPSCSGLFAWALLGFGNIYYGLARRALDMTIEAVKSKRSIGLTRSMAYHAELQHRVARDGAGVRVDRPASRSRRRRLVERRRSRRRVAGEDLRGQVPRGRGVVAHRRSRARSGGRVRDLPPRAGSNSSSATRASAASTRPTRC